MHIDLSPQEQNLRELQSASLRLVASLVAALGYIWLVSVIWMRTGSHAPRESWLGALLLVSTASAGLLLGRRYLRLASHLLIWGSIGGVACAVFTFRLPGLAYLLILPITFASVLLGWTALFPAAGVATVLVGAIIERRLGLTLASVEGGLPLAVIALVAVASWLSARNLYIALGWVWNGYEQAHQNERIARQQQGELRRALKALDEATYRLERANYMLTLARDQAEEARRLKQQFAQNISHELRTPLNLIVGFVELMTHSPEYYGGQLPTAYVRDLAIVHRNARHLQALVDDVLDLARIEAAQMGIVPEETDPGALAEEAVNTARSLVESRGLALLTEIEPGLPRLWLDPTRIRQVLFNLLNNAARFTERGSITVRVQRQGDEVLFAVADTGVGVDPENLPRIFEEFQQLDGTTRRRHGGAGLGLAISRRFVELHGGRIWAESRLGLGSTFYFSLPTRQPDPITAAGLQPGRAMARGGEGRAGAGREVPLLLAVTHSASAATLLARYLHGCRTVVAPDLQQASHLAQELMPQAVIVDASSEPVEPARLEELARAWGLARTPFLACPLPAEKPLAEHLAVDGYLIKPVSRQGLLDVLRQFGEQVDNILAVDDDRDFVRLVARLLDDPVRRYQVVGAYSGQEGLALMRHHTPDLVLLDLRLPDMDGQEIVERIRATPAWQHIPIVVVSAQDEPDRPRPLTGPAVLAKGDGLMPGEVVQWVQGIVDTAATAAPVR